MATMAVHSQVLLPTADKNGALQPELLVLSTNFPFTPCGFPTQSDWEQRIVISLLVPLSTVHDKNSEKSGTKLWSQISDALIAHHWLLSWVGFIQYFPLIHTNIILNTMYLLLFLCFSKYSVTPSSKNVLWIYNWTVAYKPPNLNTEEVSDIYNASMLLKISTMLLCFSKKWEIVQTIQVIDWKQKKQLGTIINWWRYNQCFYNKNLKLCNCIFIVLTYVKNVRRL